MVKHPDGVERPKSTAAFKRAQESEWRRANAQANELAKKAGLKNDWNHKMAMIVARPEIIVPLPEQWEVEFNEWKAKWDAPLLAQIPSIQPLLDEDPAKRQVEEKAVKYTEAELAAMDDDQRERAKRAEEIAAAAREETVERVGERITQADKTNDRHSLRRALDSKLYLVVKKNRQDYSWQFPQIALPLDLTNEQRMLRDIATEGVTTAIGKGAHIYMTGNAPAGVFSYPYSSDVQKSLNSYGAKVFFYRGYYVKGDVHRPSRYVDHAWVTKSELKDYIQDPALYTYLDGILS